MEFYILGVLGILIHFLKKMYEARKQKIQVDYVLELISNMISILIVLALVYAKDSVEIFYPVTKLTVIILGYSAQSIFRTLVNSTIKQQTK